MKDADRYAKIVAWSEEAQCYVGSAPVLILGGCHGDRERAMFDEPVTIIDEIIALYRADGEPLPVATAGRFIDAAAE